MMDLDRLFYPRNIAFVGASENILKWGSYLFTNIIDGGYSGNLYPVSKSRETIYGRRAYPTLGEIEGEIDLVIVTTPASTVMDILAQCSSKGVRNMILITSGFSETGAEGVELEKRVSGFARENGIRIVGPNTMGIVNTQNSLFANGTHVRPGRGGISIIAQSGNVGNQMMEWAEQENIGLSKFVGSGNECVLKCEDYLEYFAEDEDTSVIVMYIEGVDDGRRFFEVAKKAAKKKPVIALKAGRTGTGGRAAASHTGALAGSYRIFEAAARQSGIIVAGSPMELLALASAFDSLPLPGGNRVGVVTLGGGWGVVTADECEERGLTLPELPEKIRDHLDSMLPAFWSRGNPVDLVGQPDVNVFRESIEIMMSSDAYDAIVFLGIVGSMKFIMRVYEAARRLGGNLDADVKSVKKRLDEVQNQILDRTIELMEKYDKPVYPVALILTDEDDIIHRKEDSRYSAIIYKSHEEAVLCLEKQYQYSRFLSSV